MDTGTDPAANEPGSGSTGLRQRFGSARRPQRPVARLRPDGMDDATVAALGKISEALEAAEDARGHLYAFHRLSGRADLILQDGVRALGEAGQAELADEIDDVLVGRDVIDGHWTFELVEMYDEQYFAVFREVEAEARRRVVEGTRHLFEAEMKHREQNAGTA
ncbi:hypothetical protein M6D93_11300 [Jatrophihabitans telluris]|uniref:Uncharacterized protein n=1 Tax=Jatrophihabitans telluris TaxID=2038343 RepID=A0ABY4QSZ6_9ACTN|nr:hypothetical protein [Jatrophihabitans telluris]UQX86891.1 hypothetical protein M6D93_11300 [Jatrophihabitans telluris]